MGWAVGYDEKWKRDVGYGVPSICDQPGCNEEIDRGLAYVCGDAPYGGEHGCGLFFCGKHLIYKVPGMPFRCGPCQYGRSPFTPKPDVKEWVQHKMTDPSWEKWRTESPDEVKRLAAILNT